MELLQARSKVCQAKKSVAVPHIYKTIKINIYNIRCTLITSFYFRYGMYKFILIFY